MSQQGLLQQSVRDASGSTANLTFEGDWHALFDLDGIAAGTWNGRMLAWINGFLGTSYDNLPGAQAAMAAEAGASNWGSIGTIDLGGEADLWEPADLGAALVAWWNADDLASGVVASWADRIAGLAPVQATGTNQPVKAATSFNGTYPGVTFDGINDRLRVASTGSLPVGTTAGDVYVAASNAEVGTVVTLRYAFSYGANTANAGRVLGRVGVSNVNRYRTSDSTGTLTDTVVDFSGAHILEAQYGAAAITAWIDGKATSPASAATAFNTAVTETTIGAISSGAAAFWSGIIRHIFITTALTTDQRQKLEGWMAHDSGLASLLDASHPYKAAPP